MWTTKMKTPSLVRALADVQDALAVAPHPARPAAEVEDMRASMLNTEAEILAELATRI